MGSIFSRRKLSSHYVVSIIHGIMMLMSNYLWRESGNQNSQNEGLFSTRKGLFKSSIIKESQTYLKKGYWTQKNTPISMFI